MNNNKLIAEFMELETSDGCYFEHLTKKGNTELTHHILLQYHISWDWLMPVVEKIESQYKANFTTKCTWNEFNEYSYYQVIVNIEQGEMSRDRKAIYDSEMIYSYIGDSVKCKIDATYQAVIEFIKNYE